MKSDIYGLRKSAYPKRTCQTRATNSEYRLEQLKYPKYNAQRSARLYRENFVAYIIFLTITLTVFALPIVCMGYTSSPFNTLICVLSILAIAAMILYKTSDNQALNNTTMAIAMIMCLGPIIPIHYMNGIQYSTHINESTIKITNGIKDNHNISNISYNDIYQGGGHNMNADIPSNAVLSPGPASFTPISIIEPHGWTQDIGNWISDQREIGVQVTQQSHQFTILIHMQNWIDFKESAISPYIAANTHNAEQEAAQQRDAKLHTNLSTAVPL